MLHLLHGAPDGCAVGASRPRFPGGSVLVTPAFSPTLVAVPAPVAVPVARTPTPIPAPALPRRHRRIRFFHGGLLLFFRFFRLLIGFHDSAALKTLLIPPENQ